MTACRVLGDGWGRRSVAVNVLSIDILDVAIDGVSVFAPCVSLFQAIELELCTLRSVGVDCRGLRRTNKLTALKFLKEAHFENLSLSLYMYVCMYIWSSEWF